MEGLHASDSCSKHNLFIKNKLKWYKIEKSHTN